MNDERSSDELTPADMSAMIVNPFYAIEFDSALAVRHEPIISEDHWISANVRLINELGPELYLRNLLGVLKGHSQ